MQNLCFSISFLFYSIKSENLSTGNRSGPLGGGEGGGFVLYLTIPGTRARRKIIEVCKKKKKRKKKSYLIIISSLVCLHFDFRLDCFAKFCGLY